MGLPAPPPGLGLLRGHHGVLRRGPAQRADQDHLLRPAAEGRSLRARVQGPWQLRQSADHHPDGQAQDRRHLQSPDPGQGLAADARRRPGSRRRPRPDPVDRHREGALRRGDAGRRGYAAADGRPRAGHRRGAPGLPPARRQVPGGSRLPDLARFHGHPGQRHLHRAAAGLRHGLQVRAGPGGQVSRRRPRGLSRRPAGPDRLGLPPRITDDHHLRGDSGSAGRVPGAVHAQRRRRGHADRHQPGGGDLGLRSHRLDPCSDRAPAADRAAAAGGALLLALRAVHRALLRGLCARQGQGERPPRSPWA